MQIIENNRVQEKVYIEKMENGLTVMIFPRKNIQKKYIIWGTKFGSIDNHFISPEDTEETEVPDGIAHYLEHKLFEQENGKNSLDVLSSLGVDANAYTSNSLTAYLYDLQGKRKTVLVHRIVAKAFLDNPDKLNEIDHMEIPKTML